MNSSAGKTPEKFLIDLTDPDVCVNFFNEDSALSTSQNDQNASHEPQIKLEDDIEFRNVPDVTTGDRHSDMPESTAQASIEQDVKLPSMKPHIASPSISVPPLFYGATDEDLEYEGYGGDFVMGCDEIGSNWPPVDSEGEDSDADDDINARSQIDAVDDQNASYELPDYVPEDSSEDEPGLKRTKKPSRKAQTESDQPTEKEDPDDDENSLEAGLGNLLRSYMNGDVFEDISNSKGRDDQPTFDAAHTKRTKAMQQMGKELSKASKKELKQLNKDIRDFCKRRCHTSSDGCFIINGMLSSLEQYQVDGLVKMRRREEQKGQPRGGLLADQMGLGKTVMMLANIVLGLTEGKVQGPTLIVVPTAILNQWHREIQKHVKEGFLGHTYLWYAGNKGARIPDPRIAKVLFKSMGIILTTYWEISHSYPKKPEFPDDLEPAKQQWWWNDYVAKHAGVFHQMKFHRVVFDEAQEIKNYKSHRSAACRALKTNHIWAVSGTPIQNTLDEFYAYFKLFRVKDSGTIKEFRHNYSNADDKKAIARLVSQISKWTIRRTHADEYLGAKPLTLPKPTKKSITLPMSPLERDVYTIVEKRFLERITGLTNHDNDGDELTKRQYGHVLVLTLRLRQLTVHPLLIQDCIRDLLIDEDFDKLHEVLDMHRAYHETDQAVISHLRYLLQNKEHLEVLESFGDSSASEASASEAPLAVKSTGGAYGVNNSFREYLGAMKQAQDQDRKTRVGCPCCRQPPSQPMMTSCNHIYCYECVTKLSYEAQQAGHLQSGCLICGQTIRALRDYGETPNQPSSQVAPTDKDYQNFRVRRRNALRSAIKQWIDMDGNVVHSTKTQAIKAQVLQWKEEDPDGKIIIYSQFATVREILRRICEIEARECRMYHGGMDADQKDKALQAFKTVPGIKILLASLRAGGVGLNLTEASYVIIVEPWWNPAAEDQAFCRTYRRGQTKETHLRRCIMLNTIDEALVKKQEEKSANISKALNPDALHGFTKVQLKSLFSTHKNAGHGNTYIQPRTQTDDDLDAPLPGEGIEGQDDYLPADDAPRGFMGGR